MSKYFRSPVDNDQTPDIIYRAVTSAFGNIADGMHARQKRKLLEEQAAREQAKEQATQERQGLYQPYRAPDDDPIRAAMATQVANPFEGVPGGGMPGFENGVRPEEIAEADGRDHLHQNVKRPDGIVDAFWAQQEHQNADLRFKRDRQEQKQKEKDAEEKRIQQALKDYGMFGLTESEARGSDPAKLTEKYEAQKDRQQLERSLLHTGVGPMQPGENVQAYMQRATMRVQRNQAEISAQRYSDDARESRRYERQGRAGRLAGSVAHIKDPAIARRQAERLLTTKDRKYGLTAHEIVEEALGRSRASKPEEAPEAGAYKVFEDEKKEHKLDKQGLVTDWAEMRKHLEERFKNKVISEDIYRRNLALISQKVAEENARRTKGKKK